MGPPSSPLAQAFYVSPQFSPLQDETRDYRFHPVLGGISSTRWDAYERFAKRNSLLVDRLSNLVKVSIVIQLKRKPSEPFVDGLPESSGLLFASEKRARLRQRGLL